MRYINLLILITLCSCQESFDVGNDNSFAKTFGHQNGTSPRILRKIADHYFVVGADFIEPFTVQNGRDPDFAAVQVSPTMIRFDQFGNQTDKKTFEIDRVALECHERVRNEALGINEDSVFFQLNGAEFRDIIQLDNGHYVVSGWYLELSSINQPRYTFDFPFKYVPFVFVLDHYGRALRRFHFDCDDTYRFYDKLIQLDNNDFLITARQSEYLPNQSPVLHYSIARMNEDGDILWERDYGQEETQIGVDTRANKIILDSSGELVAVGTINVPNEKPSVFIHRINPIDGGLIQEASIESTEYNLGWEVVEIPAINGFAVGQFRRSVDDGPSRVVVTLLDQNLNEIESFDATGTEMFNSELDIVNATDGHLVVKGTLFDAFTGFDVFNPSGFNFESLFVKVSLDGEVLWRNINPGGLQGIPRNMVAADNGSVLALRFAQFGKGPAKGLLIKLNQDGKISN